LRWGDPSERSSGRALNDCPILGLVGGARASGILHVPRRPATSRSRRCRRGSSNSKKVWGVLIVERPPGQQCRCDALAGLIRRVLRTAVRLPGRAVCTTDDRHRGPRHLHGHRTRGVTLDRPATLGLGSGRRLSIAAMMTTRTVHPSAGPNPVIVFLGHSAWSFLLFPVSSGALILVLIAWPYNNAWRKTPYPLLVGLRRHFGRP
jgi:HPP family